MAEKWYPGKHLGLKKSKAGANGTTDSGSNSMPSTAATAPAPVLENYSAEEPSPVSEHILPSNFKDRTEGVSDDTSITAAAPSSSTAMPIPNNTPPSSSPQESEKWYPGKLLGVMSSSKEPATSSPGASSSIGTSSAAASGQASKNDDNKDGGDDEKWYPGKNVAAAAAAMPRPLLALRRRVVAKRALKQPSSAGVAAVTVDNGGLLGGGNDQSGGAVATLRVTLLQGRKLEGIRRPFVELCVDGFEHRSSTKRGSNPNWRVKKSKGYEKEVLNSSGQSMNGKAAASEPGASQGDENEQDDIDSVGTGRMDLGDSNHGNEIDGKGEGSGRGESFVFNVWDLKASSNVTVLLFDDYDVRRDKCTGRVVIPLSSLLAQSSIHAPTAASPHWSLATSAISVLGGGSISSTSSSNNNTLLTSGCLNFLEAMTSSAGATLPPQRQWYHILPPAAPHATKEATAAAARASAAAGATTSSSVIATSGREVEEATVEFLAQSRYESGVMGVPASAMPRPRVPLGYLELEVELTMSTPLLHAYLQTPPHLLHFANIQDNAANQQAAGADSSSTAESASTSKGTKDNGTSRTTATPTTLHGKAAKSSDVSGGGGGKAPVDDAVSAAESLDPRKLRMNVARLKRALSGRSPLLAESIWRIGVLLPLIARACFWMPAREFPFWVFCLVVLHGYLARDASTPVVAARAVAAANANAKANTASSNASASTSTAVGGSSTNRSGTSTTLTTAVSVSGLPPWMLMYDDEVGPPTVPRGALSKIRLLKSTVAKLQVTVGKAALFLEKSANLWNWSDPAVTFLATCALGAVCLTASLILTIVPFNVLLFVALASKLLTYKPAAGEDPEATTAGAAEEAGTGTGGNSSAHSNSTHARGSNDASNAIDTGDEIDDENDDVGIGDHLFASRHGPNSSGSSSSSSSRHAQSTAAVKAAVVQACQAVLARVPDENELVHRAIANLQPLRGVPP